MAKKQTIILLHSEEKKTPGSLLAGEIAVQNASDEAAIYLKKGESIAKIVDEDVTDEKIATAVGNGINGVLDTIGEGFNSAFTVTNAYEQLDTNLDTLSGAVEDIEASAHTHSNKNVLDGITAEKVAAWDAAETNAEGYADGLKEEIDAYTVNGKAINASPVLDGSDINLSASYAMAEEATEIAGGDSVEVALGKLEKQIENAVAGGLQEVEAGDGINVTEVSGNKQTISIKLDDSTTDAGFLSVGPDGLSLDGITERIGVDIETEIGKLNATAGTQTIASGKHVAVQVVEANGKVTTVNVAESDIASSAEVATLSASVITLSGAVEDAIEAVDTKFGSYATSAQTVTAIANAKSEAIDSASAYTDNAIEALDLENTYADKDYEEKVDTLVGTDTGKSARAIATEEAASAVAAVVDGAPESFDTLKEIAEWIIEDPTHSADIVTDITDLKGRMTTAEGDISELENGLGTAQDDIDALEELVGDTAVATQITNAIATETARTETAYAKKAYEATVDTHTADTTVHITAAERTNWNAAEQNAKDYADGLNTAMDTRVDALEAISAGTRLTALEAISADSRLTTIENDYLTEADKTELAGDINALSGAVESAIAGSVVSFGGQTGAITVDGTPTADGTVKLSMDGKTLKATLNGSFANSADTVAAIDAVDEKVDTLSGSVETLSASVVGNYATSADTVAAISAVDAKFADYATSANTVAAISAVDAKFANYATSADTVDAIEAVDEKVDGLAEDVIKEIEFTNAGENGATIDATVASNKATFDFGTFVIDGGTY